MSSVLLVQAVKFGSDPKIKDNSFIVAEEISDEKQTNDERAAFKTIRDLRTTIAAHGVDARVIRNKDEPNPLAYLDHGDAIFPNNYISFHNFTDDAGTIVRRLVILYPMSAYRRKELAETQIVQKLETAADKGLITLLDLRSYEEEDRALEGTGALVFSPDGRYVYMSRSGRTDDEILSLICSPEYLNIPAENRFLFGSAVPRADGSGEDLVYHTNVIGWCGKGIAAFALELLKFDSGTEKDSFHRHLEREYDRVVDLSADEIRAFSGNAFELATRKPDGAEHHFVCLSSTSYHGLSEKHRALLEQWYGSENVCSFVNEAVERRTGGSIRCMMGASIQHGAVLPRHGEESTLELVGLVEKSE